jgi:hypothetical protein
MIWIKRVLLGMVAVVAFLLVVFVFLRSRTFTADMTVINKSTKDIDYAFVGIRRGGDGLFRIDNLKAGDRYSGCLNIKANHGFFVVAKFADGMSFREGVGYMEGGSDEANTIEIYDDHVDLVASGQIESPYIAFHRCKA